MNAAAAVLCTYTGTRTGVQLNGQLKLKLNGGSLNYDESQQ